MRSSHCSSLQMMKKLKMIAYLIILHCGYFYSISSSDTTGSWKCVMIFAKNTRTSSYCYCYCCYYLYLTYYLYHCLSYSSFYYSTASSRPYSFCNTLWMSIIINSPSITNSLLQCFGTTICTTHTIHMGFSIAVVLVTAWCLFVLN